MIMTYVLKVSYGNDSIALMQWAHENELDGAYCLYSETHWGASWWPERVTRGEEWAKQYGFVPVRTDSIGMERLVHIKSAWPSRGAQFCTEQLKVQPYQKWLTENDPDKELVAVCGVRREESQRRRKWPEWVEVSDVDLERSLWSPLVSIREAERDALIVRAGWEVLPHRSKECSPCIYSNRHDLIRLEPDRIGEVDRIECDMGHTSNGKPRTLFRPKKFMGAVGIREVIKWANSPVGAYDTDQMFLGGAGCDSGFCAE